jgi:acyl carrier protein
MNTFDQVQKLIVDELGVPVEDVKPETTLDDGLGADSLDRIELRIAVEEEFAIYITDPEADAVLTVADLVAIVDRKVTAKGA